MVYIDVGEYLHVSLSKFGTNEIIVWERNRQNFKTVLAKMFRGGERKETIYRAGLWNATRYPVAHMCIYRGTYYVYTYLSDFKQGRTQRGSTMAGYIGGCGVNNTSRCSYVGDSS